MKSLLFILLSALSFSSSVFAEKNSYAPKLNNIVVIYDVADKEYFPFFFHLLMGETFIMKMNSSCSHVQIDSQQNVLCRNSRGLVRVGTLSKVVNQNGFESAYQVKWLTNVEILETKRLNGNGYTYSVLVK